ncbi:cobyrinate a,c-diamide synthase [Lentisphaerota bacterium ZTH]|nr:cobyrinate a,c-diamide synthase [Lentisphaerota bacterium]WET07542.1 cobyrinate a,c-diamide synthase [Lentisphaerota bacterium ZTH]
MKNTANKISAFCVAGTSSGDGKTTVTLALLRALKKRGLKVQPFKCGPDYIDPAFHKNACGTISRNLDGWMMGKSAVKASFSRAAAAADCAVIEGVMGLFDSSKPGSLQGSTAEVAITLDLPVILTVNARGMANSIAPLVKGYTEFNKDLKIAGVIANKVGSARHADILRETLTHAGLPPLLGYLPREDDWVMPERHLGLVPVFENKRGQEWFDSLAEAVEKYFDLDRIIELTHTAALSNSTKKRHKKGKLRLGLAYDKAFNFYYEDNLDMLRDNGFELVRFSPLIDETLPEDLNGIYIGGGFPEVFARVLSANTSMRQAIKDFACNGGFIYAECGGYMYLTNEIKNSDGTFPMCGIINANASMGKRMRSLGYRVMKPASKFSFLPENIVMRGHEFHWSNIKFKSEPKPLWLAHNTREEDFSPCGFRHGRVFASYLHLHFASCPQAVQMLADFIRQIKKLQAARYQP